MRIAFDLDDTLICYGGDVPCEATVPAWAFPARWWCREPLRAGATRLLRDLTGQGHDVWIYTSSYRSPRYLRLWFRLLGVRLGGVVNADRHSNVVRSGRPGAGASKYPPAFGIDLLVDDRPGVALEGERYGFAVCLVARDDCGWAEHVRRAVTGAVSRGTAPNGSTGFPA
ncbi:MAG: hypothetical protein JWO31_2685 [Phycisphaerales bacterium]|nr:hypothetical protein [Phycisphaerales bacterium]